MTNKNNLNGKAWFGLAVAATSLSAFNQQQASADDNANQNGEVANQQSQRDAALAKFAAEHTSGYVYSPEVSTENGGYNWFEDGQLFTGFRFHAGSYYWFVNGVRQNAGWREAWGNKYYTDNDGRAVQGKQTINGQVFDFGDDDTFYLRTSGYLYDGSDQNGGYRWYENGQLFTGFRYYTGTYYWFVDGVRQNAGWREAWGHKYYTDADGRAVQGIQTIDGKQYNFGDDNTFYLREDASYTVDGKVYHTDQNGQSVPWTGYIYDGSSQNGGYRWYEDGKLYTGFRYYTGTYYWFIDGVRQNAGWRQAWGLTYYTDNDGRAVQGSQYIDGQWYFFGDDGTYYRRFASSEVANWFYKNYGKITYSMYGSRTGSDGTADCSGAMVQALVEAGATKPAYIYNTDSIHDYLKANGYQLVAENTKVNKEVGDIVVWGRRGNSGGANGHIMVINQADNSNGSGAREISVDYWTNGGYNSAVSEHDYNYYAAANDYPYFYVYRHA